MSRELVNFRFTREYFGLVLKHPSIKLYKIHWYGVGYLLSFVIIRILIFQRIKYFGIKLTKAELNEMAEVSMISGVIGGRIWFLIDRYLATGISPFYRPYQVWEGGMAFQGGLLLGFCGGVLWVLLRKKELAKLSDVVTSCLPVGIMIGRIGNFLNQEFMWPVPVNLLIFNLTIISQLTCLTRSSIWLFILGLCALIKLDTLFIPSCIFSSITEGLTVFLLLRQFIYRQYARPFQTTTLFFCLYGLFRFVNDCFRQEVNYKLFHLNFKLSQYVALLIITCSLTLYFLTTNLQNQIKDATVEGGPKKNKEN